MKIRARLAKNMVRFRKAKEWSQEELADRSSLHRTYISGLERQLRNPTIDVIEKVALAFNVDVVELLG